MKDEEERKIAIEMIIFIIPITISIIYLTYEKVNNNYSKLEINLTYWLISNLIFGCILYPCSEYISYRKKKGKKV